MQPNRPSNKAIPSPGQPPGNAAGGILESRFSSDRGKKPPSPLYAALLADARKHTTPYRLLLLLDDLNPGQVQEIEAFRTGARKRRPTFTSTREVLCLIDSMDDVSRAWIVDRIAWRLLIPTAMDDAAKELAAQAQELGMGYPANA